MTKSVRIIALVLVLATFACVLASCGKTLSGTYVLTATDIDLGDLGGTQTKVTFKGNKMTTETTTKLFGKETTTTEEATYKIAKNDEGELEFIKTVTVDGKEVSSTYTFEELENGDVKIGGFTYEKQ